ncbi:hypothetical protein [Nibribacter koreensis]
MSPIIQFEQYYKDEFIHIHLDPRLSLLQVEWCKHPQSSEFRAVFQKLAGVVLDTKVKYWLSDPRAIHYLELGDQNWLIKDMAPLLKQSSLLKFARLVTKESLEMMDIVQILGNLEKTLDLEIQTQFELFVNREDALEWLLADL